MINSNAEAQNRLFSA